MTVSDMFKSSFLKNVTSVSVLDMVLALGLAFAIGLFIFLIYRKTYAGAVTVILPPVMRRLSFAAMPCL